jgi:hypothetical protein
MKVSGQLHAPFVLLPDKKTRGAYFIGGLCGQRYGLGVVAKRKLLACSRELNPDRSSRVSDYTD